jgi:hypothetical protein
MEQLKSISNCSKGFKVSLNTIASYRLQLGLQAVLAVRQVNTTVSAKEHKKYSGTA